MYSIKIRSLNSFSKNEIKTLIQNVDEFNMRDDQYKAFALSAITNSNVYYEVKHNLKTFDIFKLDRTYIDVCFDIRCNIIFNKIKQILNLLFKNRYSELIKIITSYIEYKASFDIDNNSYVIIKNIDHYKHYIPIAGLMYDNIILKMNEANNESIDIQLTMKCLVLNLNDRKFTLYNNILIKDTDYIYNNRGIISYFPRKIKDNSIKELVLYELL